MITSTDKEGQITKTHRVTLDALRPFIIAVRPHHWLKNLLIFVPLIVSHKALNISLLDHVGIGCLAFCLTSSAGYLFNDLLDVHADRQNPGKCHRPFANNSLSITNGKISIVVFLAIAIFLCLLLPENFALILTLYLIASLFYSIRLKREPILDVLMLGGLYTIRIIAGCTVIAVNPSFWLLAFSMFFFLSLALLKRYAEIIDLCNRGGIQIERRGYACTDLNIICTMGVASGYISVLVLAFYVNSKEILLLYTHHHFFWILCLLAFYWVSRAWLLAHRGQMNMDPLVYALKDHMSQIVCLLSIIVILISI